MLCAEHRRDPRDARELSGTIAKLSRPRTTTAGGFDLTFSPVKSVSALWAVAPTEVAAQVELAHNEAVADALTFIEQHALYSREGTNGVRQVDVTGLVAAAFTHRDPAPVTPIFTLTWPWRTRCRPYPGSGSRSTGASCSRQR